jgi:hypothetical protein
MKLDCYLRAPVAGVNERAATISHATQGCFRRYRSVDAGYFTSIAAGRIGRLTKLPLQFGQTSPNTVAAQSAQNVHSKVHIRASRLSGGRSRSQHSQFGFSFIMTRPLLSVFNAP